MRFFPLVLVFLILILLGSEQVLDLADKAFSLLLETALPREGVTWARRRRGRC